MKVSCHCDLRTSRNCALKCIAFTLCILTLVRIGFSQTLSATSGINPQDTYVVFDLGVQSSGTVTLPDAVYSPSTRTVSTAFNVSPLARTMHVEAGYDTNGNLVMNLYLNPTTANPYAVSVSPVGVVRYAQGQVTLFDTNNLPISPVMPNSSLTALLPSWLQVSSKGASLIGNFRVSNIRSFAVAQNASLNLQGSTASLTFPSGPSPQVVWTYTQSGSYWVPSQVQVTPTVANGAVTHTLQFSNLAISDNATNDASRASQFPTLQSPAASNSNVPALDAPEVEASCTPGGGETNHLGGTQNIAFQHGFMSDPSTWVRMVPWLNQDFILGTELLSATDWCSGVADQANTLEQEIQSAGGSNYIIVAHSLGGLVSRDAAQHFQSTPTPVRGVATMNTPHLGADLAANGPPALGVGLTFLSNALYGWMGCGSQNDNVGCFDAWLAANGGAYIVGNWAPGTVGAVADMTPGSALLNQLNNPPQQENFLQAGITAYTPQRWLITREMDEMFFGSVCYPESKCGERAIAADTEYLYDATETNFLLDLLLSQYCEESLNCPNPYTDALGQQMNFDAGLMGWMNAIDGVYDAFMGCNFSLLFCEGSDGLIQFSSQQYPESTATQYPLTPPNADAHGGATKSNYDRTALDNILAQKFGVQTPAGCSYQPSTGSIIVPASGETYSFNVATGQGCQWSATSNQPWLTVNTPTGTSSGPVSFTALANPLNTSLQGVISVGSSTSTTSVYVTEAGVCSYTLTPGPEIAVAGAGGTGTISVNTQTGCVWSAVSSAPSWLTITGAATGTGSGTFQYSAAANATGGDQAATITVAGQILTVLQGTTSGAPGTGTVTIYGSPQSTEVNQCPGNPHGPCMETIWEGGAVAIWVNGQSYSAQYSGTLNSSASLAQALAALMNTPLSPISATVSGSTITITATVDGTATNYPLSASYGFNTSNFSTPAFYGSASGPFLTGGAN